MADLKPVEVAVDKAAKGEELTPQEEQAVMESNETEQVTDKAPEKEAPDPEAEQPPETTGIKKEGEPEAEPKGEKEGEEPEDAPSDKEEPETPEGDKEKGDLEKRLEKELEKPYGEEDLSDYTPRERAFFYEMRRERRKRQEKQEEFDLFRFKHLQERAKEPAPEKEPEAKKEPKKDPFEGKDEDEFLTVGDVKKILNENQPKPGTKNEEKLVQVNQNLMMRNWFLEGQMRHDDFLDVVNSAPEVLEGDKDAAQEIMETARRGGNPALTTYNLVKASSKYKGEKPEAERDVHQDRAKRIETNAKKPRTTGGSGSGSVPAGEYTYEELVSMSDDDFTRISPDKREKLLKKFEGLA